MQSIAKNNIDNGFCIIENSKREIFVPKLDCSVFLDSEKM